MVTNGPGRFGSYWGQGSLEGVSQITCERFSVQKGRSKSSVLLATRVGMAVSSMYAVIVGWSAEVLESSVVVGIL